MAKAKSNINSLLHDFLSEEPPTGPVTSEAKALRKLVVAQRMLEQVLIDYSGIELEAAQKQAMAKDLGRVITLLVAVKQQFDKR